MSHVAAATIPARGKASDAVTRTEPAAVARPYEGPLPQVDNARAMAPADARELSRLFLMRLKALEEGTREYQYARNTLIEMNISLVRFAARRFAARINADIEIDDVIQVGTIGLIKAIDRFDPDREVEFSTLAIPYITGEIKRYFRDTTWAVHVPRRLQELRVELAKCQETLTETLGRAPSVKEIAGHLELSEEEVSEGLVAANGYSSTSIDSAGGTTDRTAARGEGRPLSDTVGDVDSAMTLFEDCHTLAPLLRALSPQARGEWKPDGWHLPMLLVCVAAVAVVIWVARLRRRK
ncbi:sigma-70 family RNA polymerase sigma factor [Streptomyces sp. NPDC099050]|uniref:sigma-70 family RNA polymerase sigma factor n=1 Tax=Streptomyces sp. NPDC099050 TaxID=3366100 RepID=UPI00381FE9FE